MLSKIRIWLRAVRKLHFEQSVSVTHCTLVERLNTVSGEDRVCLGVEKTEDAEVENNKKRG